MKILHVVGARPNFMKAAPVMEAVSGGAGLRQRLVHTGQHFDEKMSAIFFHQLGMPQPDYFLNINGGSHAELTARVMLSLEGIFVEERPDLVMVYGDVNSTVAAALVASKLRIKVAHVEAGLRSFDRSMPEEVNRVLTDQIADIHYIPSIDAKRNLDAEGLSNRDIQLVGNVMIDSLVRALPHARQPEDMTIPDSFALVTLHRPANVDERETLAGLMSVVAELAETYPVIFPLHPRTKQQLEASGIPIPEKGRIQLIDPMGYFEFLWCMQHASLVLTDSGGIQEETTYLGVPCFTARDNTERPVTIDQGTNLLVGANGAGLLREVEKLRQREDGKEKTTSIPDKWDGRAAKRIAEHLLRL